MRFARCPQPQLRGQRADKGRKSCGHPGAPFGSGHYIGWKLHQRCTSVSQHCIDCLACSRPKNSLRHICTKIVRDCFWIDSAESLPRLRHWLHLRMSLRSNSPVQAVNMLADIHVLPPCTKRCCKDLCIRMLRRRPFATGDSPRRYTCHASPRNFAHQGARRWLQHSGLEPS